MGTPPSLKFVIPPPPQKLLAKLLAYLITEFHIHASGISYAIFNSRRAEIYNEERYVTECGYYKLQVDLVLCWGYIPGKHRTVKITQIEHKIPI
jgi:hypothetical protein